MNDEVLDKNELLKMAKSGTKDHKAIQIES